MFKYQGRERCIGIVHIQDSSSKIVTVFELHKDGALSGTPHWSSDENRIVFCLDLNTWVVDTSGENIECLVEYAAYPNWSPDGEQIVFTKCDEDGCLWIMDSDGKNQRPLRKE